MLSVLTALLGFLGPFLPQILKVWETRENNKHELEVMRVQAEIAAQQHAFKIEELNTNADIAESAALRTPQTSFGVQVLDAAKGQGLSAWIWMPVFWMFALLDWLSGMVRPTITYAVVTFWLVYKIAVFNYYATITHTTAQAIMSTWNADDMAVLFLVLGYWFGQRAMKAVFGGSAATGKPGAG